MAYELIAGEDGEVWLVPVCTCPKVEYEPLAWRIREIDSECPTHSPSSDPQGGSDAD